VYCINISTLYSIQHCFFIWFCQQLFGCVLALIGSIKPKAAFDNVLLHTNKGDKVAVNVFAHTAIFAASRHGKTASLVLPYAKHFAEYRFCRSLL
jgi:hypothetical protein